ncbi:Protein-lysine N-methyltransferase efm4 [Saxophila tyrrhenica]|uniref:Protein-lysine N-methyltransferase EFM4 n=1 Tax=Saxophila tyrrhenica TaxID=1690608 RepID=A0AAV9PN47_9PEZI|nr:Protein-lysine N-methyltransferase efm4 [Saxophila tyrrhenica]
MENQAHNETLNPSELGTKDYWDNLYDRELENHQQDKDDEGTVWFSESNAEETVLKQLDRLADEGLLRRTAEGDSRASRFLDLGTGNGHMLFCLRDTEDDEPWCGDMVGVDYSTASVQLARRIAAQKQSDDADEPLGPLRLECWDLLSSPPGDWLEDGFDVVLDKGTFDAISLMDSQSSDRHPCKIYREKVMPLVAPRSFLIVTSCNWTKGELEKWLAPAGSELTLYAEAKYPTFTFGGQTGQSIVTVLFRRSAG